MTKSHAANPGVDAPRRQISGTRRAARENPRADLEVAVRFDDGVAMRDALARNMSLGGMFIATDAPSAFGKTVDVELELGLGAPTKVRCFVRWTNAEGMGVQFDMMGARETHALTGLLQARGV